ncbi:MAG: hypothetical protein M5U28_36915 [Sandaracinaceae bacterium]|nr:hypothetical protein [Sandaracinaceae bacterium]
MIFVLGAAFCAFATYLTAGGQHGWAEFQATWQDELTGRALPYLLGTLTLGVLGGALLIGGRRDEARGED